jgi:hypothetical protein
MTKVGKKKRGCWTGTSTGSPLDKTERTTSICTWFYTFIKWYVDGALFVEPAVFSSDTFIAAIFDRRSGA